LKRLPQAHIHFRRAITLGAPPAGDEIVGLLTHLPLGME
jgi:hypothetical protein